MNFSSFVSDLVTALIGSGLGIIAGLQIDRRQNRMKARARDERLVQNLIDRLAGKRAFRVEAGVGEIDDRAYCAASILDARERIAAVCDEIEEREDVICHLRNMEMDCMAYLDYSEQEKSRYAMGLSRLGDRLAQHEAELRTLMPALSDDLPGSRASRKATWLP